MPWDKNVRTVGTETHPQPEDDGKPRLKLDQPYRFYVKKSNVSIFLQGTHMFNVGKEYVGEFTPKKDAPKEIEVKEPESAIGKIEKKKPGRPKKKK